MPQAINTQDTQLQKHCTYTPNMLFYMDYGKYKRRSYKK